MRDVKVRDEKNKAMNKYVFISTASHAESIEGGNLPGLAIIIHQATLLFNPSQAWDFIGWTCTEKLVLDKDNIKGSDGISSSSFSFRY